MSPRLSLLLLAPVAALFLATGCAVSSEAYCEQDAECPEGAKCTDGICSGGDVPTAAFELPATCALGEDVVIDGSASRTKGGSAAGLRFQFRVVQPAGASTLLTNAASAKPTLKCSRPHARFTLELVVFDQGQPSAPVRKEIQVSNAKPKAMLKYLPATWSRGSSITLDAGESTDPDGDTLEYAFRVERDPPATAEIKISQNPNQRSKATFTTSNIAATYTVYVEVSDGTDKDTTSITQTIGNRAPTATVPADQAIDHLCVVSEGEKGCGAVGELKGAVSDGDSLAADPVRGAWKLKAAPPPMQAALAATPPKAEIEVVARTGKTAEADFTIVATSDVKIVGDYEFELTATDIDGATESKSMKVTVKNRPPTIAFAGGPGPRAFEHQYNPAASEFVGIAVGTVVVTDPDNDDLEISYLTMTDLPPGATADTPVADDEDPLTAGWIVHVPGAKPGSLIDATDPAKALYTAKVEVADPNEGLAAASLPVVFKNRAPVASAFEPRTSEGHVTGGSSAGAGIWHSANFSLVGITVTDPDGDPVTVRWNAVAPASAPNFDAFFRPDAIAPHTLTASAPRDASNAIVGRPFDVIIEATEPFGKTNLTTQFTIGNRAPTLAAFSTGNRACVVTNTAPGCPSNDVACPGIQCGTSKSYFSSTASLARTALSVSGVTDPDGDNVSATFELAGCVGARCLPFNRFSDAAGTAVAVTGACTGSGSMTCAPASSPFLSNRICVGGTSPILRSFVETDVLKVTVRDEFDAATSTTGNFDVRAVSSPALCGIIE